MSSQQFRLRLVRCSIEIRRNRAPGNRRWLGTKSFDYLWRSDEVTHQLWGWPHGGEGAVRGPVRFLKDLDYTKKLEQQQLRVTSAYKPLLSRELDEEQFLEKVWQEVARYHSWSSRGHLLCMRVSVAEQMVPRESSVPNLVSMSTAAQASGVEMDALETENSETEASSQAPATAAPITIRREGGRNNEAGGARDRTMAFSVYLPVCSLLVLFDEITVNYVATRENDFPQVWEKWVNWQSTKPWTVDVFKRVPIKRTQWYATWYIRRHHITQVYENHLESHINQEREKTSYTCACVVWNWCCQNAQLLEDEPVAMYPQRGEKAGYTWQMKRAMFLEENTRIEFSKSGHAALKVCHPVYHCLETDSMTASHNGRRVLFEEVVKKESLKSWIIWM